MTLNFFHHCLRVRTPPAEQSRPDSPVLSSSSVKLCTLGAHYLGETIGGWLPVSGSGEISPVILRKSFPTLSALSCVMCALVSKCPTGFLPPSGSRDWLTMCGSYEILHLSHPDPHTHTHTHHPHTAASKDSGWILWMPSVTLGSCLLSGSLRGLNVSFSATLNTLNVFTVLKLRRREVRITYIQISEGSAGCADALHQSVKIFI